MSPTRSHSASTPPHSAEEDGRALGAERGRISCEDALFFDETQQVGLDPIFSLALAFVLLALRTWQGAEKMETNRQIYLHTHEQRAREKDSEKKEG
jgi:hypothetical protein